ncbi:MAG: tetratricopeptide repeat protein [Acidobacteria bacterium]|nr:tetratricopeptide repeat protein [Acidobacteriota bacterium]
MAKRGSRRGKSKPARSAEKKLYRSLYEADELLGSGKYVEACSALLELDRQFPDHEDVLRGLANAYHSLKDTDGYQYATERLIKLAPDDPDVALGLAGAYMTNLHPMLALRGFRRFLERWPKDERASKVRRTIADVQRLASDRLRAMGFTDEEMDELGTLHDESQVLMGYGRYAEARYVAEKLIERKPKFIAVRNNLSLMYAMEGDLSSAIAVAQEALQIEPENYHTLGNLIRFHVQRGQIEQARGYAKRLKPIVDEELVDIWLKKIEALCYLGDDQDAVDVFTQAQDSKHRDLLKFTPLIFHFAAVAEMRLGNEDKARALWRQALEISPGLELARENLDDLNRPAAERHAPWPFPLTSWISRLTVDDLITRIKSAGEHGGEKAEASTARRYFDQHPELTALVPILFDRGDPTGRELAMQLATLAKTTEMFAALRDFALSQRGPDQMRLRAAQIVRREGLLPEDAIRLWVRGKWRNVIQTTNEIHFEPLFKHRPEVSELLAKGLEYSRKGDGVNSERLFKHALDLEPDSPDILNNLAFAYTLLGRLDEGDQLIRQTHQQHPDYLFGITNMANIHIHNREFDNAAELLKPLLSRKRMHHEELLAVVETNIHLYVAKGEPEYARLWLETWETIDPDDPKLQEWRMRIELQNIPEQLRRYLERNSQR